jgi:hypothetical protein
MKGLTGTIKNKKEESRPDLFPSKKTAQAKSLAPPDSGIQFTIQKKENKTGLPDNLKSGIEHLSGLDLSDVKVHYNSSQPAQLRAHAYAQGNQIHVAPGQEKQLPHEAWHVIQQKQGRVKPTKQLKSAVQINDNPHLEKEADVMGAKALKVPAAGNLMQQKKQSGSGPKVAQLVVQSKLDATGKTVYFSTHDKARLFDTVAAADAYDEKQRPPADEFDAASRYPTNYTYWFTDPHNLVPLSKQGPHSLGHAAMSHRLDKRMKDTDHKVIANKQVRSKADFAAAVAAEKPADFSADQEKRMLTDYGILHDKLYDMLDKGGYEPTHVQELIMRLMQMDPYAAYGKAMKKGGSAALAGKGEKKEKSFRDAFDKRAKFRDGAGYERFRKDRSGLFSDYESSDEEMEPEKSSAPAAAAAADPVRGRPREREPGKGKKDKASPSPDRSKKSKSRSRSREKARKKKEARKRRNSRSRSRSRSR